MNHLWKIKQTGENSSCIETRVLSSDVVVIDLLNLSSIGFKIRSGDIDIILVQVEPPNSSGKANGAFALKCLNRFCVGDAAKK